MIICSIDVGIKNLSFCLFEIEEEDKEKIKILEWTIIDLSEKYELTCSSIDKNGFCGKNAKYCKNGIYYCLKHSKKEKYILPTNELKLSYLKKQKLVNLIELAIKYNINSETNINLNNIKKQELLDLFTNFSLNNCYEIVEKVNATKIDLVNIGKNIQYKFDNILDKYIQKLNIIIIENQIGPIANKMKTIQGMIAQYFIMKNNNIKIEFINASNKLKDICPFKQFNFLVSKTDKKDEKNKYKEKVKEIENNENNINNENILQFEKKIEKGEKTDYKIRKNLSINYTLELLNNDYRFNNWLDTLQKSKKKDDLCDCFLQGLYFIKNKI